MPTDRRPADVVDEHYYSSPEFFIQQADRYDKYDRKGPKIYVGEYAVTQGCGQGNLRGAVGEAAFMMGMERNSDVVIMSSYAPLFVNVNHRGWNPDLINYDSSRVYGIPSYHVQKMFAENRGDVILPVDVQSPSFERGPAGRGHRRGHLGDAGRVQGHEGHARRPDTLVGRPRGRHQGLEAAGRRLEGRGRASCGRLGPARTSGPWPATRTGPTTRFSLKARKLGGAEGFLILFRVQDENQKSWWNIGGWGNTRHAIEIGGEIGQSVPGPIETGRWYDIRIELSGSSIKCYLDGKLVHDVKTPTMKSLHASATRVKSTGEVILKVVNASAYELATEIDVQGVTRLAGPATAVVLTSEQPTDENSLENPTKVSPVACRLEIPGSRFLHGFPGNSVTVIRVKAR